MATAKELRELTIEDLKNRETELRETLFQDLLKLKTGSLDKPSERTKHRRDLARILSVITEKSRGEKAAAEKQG